MPVALLSLISTISLLFICRDRGRGRERIRVMQWEKASTHCSDFEDGGSIQTGNELAKLEKQKNKTKQKTKKQAKSPRKCILHRCVIKNGSSIHSLILLLT